MKRIKQEIELFILSFIVIVCSVSLLCIMHQEDCVDTACVAIVNNDQETAKSNIDNIWWLNMSGSDGNTVFMTACSVGNEEIIKYLINKGVDVNYAPSGKLTPLELFCQNGYNAGFDTLYSLIEAGAQQNVYTNKPAVFYLADSFTLITNEQKSLVTEEVILLLRYGAPMKHNNTSLLHLAANSDMDSLFYTIVHTTNGLRLMTMRDDNGMTPWDVAVESGSINIQRIIRDLENEYDEVQKENQYNVN